jgi:AraC-like DNA-binding protein
MNLLQTSTTAPPSANGHRPEPVEIWKTRKFISEHLDEKISLIKVAEFVRICPTYLSERFKAVTGETFVGYVARARVARACELLENSPLRISDVAFASGFQSLSQFNRVFRKQCGESPRTYRARRAAHPRPASRVISR